MGGTTVAGERDRGVGPVCVSWLAWVLAGVGEYVMDRGRGGHPHVQGQRAEGERLGRAAA